MRENPPYIPPWWRRTRLCRPPYSAARSWSYSSASSAWRCLSATQPRYAAPSSLLVVAGVNKAVSIATRLPGTTTRYPRALLRCYVDFMWMFIEDYIFMSYTVWYIQVTLTNSKCDMNTTCITTIMFIQIIHRKVYPQCKLQHEYSWLQIYMHTSNITDNSIWFSLILDVSYFPYKTKNSALALYPNRLKLKWMLQIH